MKSSQKPFLPLSFYCQVTFKLTQAQETVRYSPVDFVKRPVNWSDQGVCCNQCSDKSCEDFSTAEMEQLNRSSVRFCCKCETMNVDSFTFNSFELYTTNMFSPLSGKENTIDSLDSGILFSPLFTSSPSQPSRKNSQTSNRSKSTPSLNTDSGLNKNCSTKTLRHSLNLRLLTVNCCSVREHSAEFKVALDYAKLDIICGTESWLRSIIQAKNQQKMQ